MDDLLLRSDYCQSLPQFSSVAQVQTWGGFALTWVVFSISQASNGVILREPQNLLQDTGVQRTCWPQQYSSK